MDPYSTGNYCLLIEWSYDLTCLDLRTSDCVFERGNIRLKLAAGFKFNNIDMMYSTLKTHNLPLKLLSAFEKVTYLPE